MLLSLWAFYNVSYPNLIGILMGQIFRELIGSYCKMPSAVLPHQKKFSKAKKKKADM
jgi:hypothetical protein